MTMSNEERERIERAANRLLERLKRIRADIEAGRYTPNDRWVRSLPRRGKGGTIAIFIPRPPREAGEPDGGGEPEVGE